MRYVRTMTRRHSLEDIVSKTKKVRGTRPGLDKSERLALRKFYLLFFFFFFDFLKPTLPALGSYGRWAI